MHPTPLDQNRLHMTSTECASTVPNNKQTSIWRFWIRKVHLRGICDCGLGYDGNDALTYEGYSIAYAREVGHGFGFWKGCFCFQALGAQTARHQHELNVPGRLAQVGCQRRSQRHLGQVLSAKDYNRLVLERTGQHRFLKNPETPSRPQLQE